MRKKYKVLLKLITFIFIVIVLILLGKNFFLKENIKEAQVIDSINSFEYTLDDRDTKLMKDNYQELKEVLKENPINDEKYASSIAKLFIIDLFTLDNKVNKYDVGAIEYVYPDARSNFKLNATDTIYKNVVIKSNRKNKLPIVKSIDILEVKENKYTLNEEEYPSYDITLSWDYETDLGYDHKGIVTCIKKDKYMYVTEYKKGE